jgi:hypothetical protein
MDHMEGQVGAQVPAALPCLGQTWDLPLSGPGHGEHT